MNEPGQSRNPLMVVGTAIEIPTTMSPRAAITKVALVATDNIGKHIGGRHSADLADQRERERERDYGRAGQVVSPDLRARLLQS